MATLSKKSSGRYVVQWNPADGGPRQTLGIGRIPRRAAETICDHVEAIVGSRRSGTRVPDAAAAWVASVGKKLHRRLVAKGLAQPRPEEADVELGAFLTAYIAGRSDLKASTLTVLKQTQASLVTHFGKARTLSSITRGDAADWHRQVRSCNAAATAAKHLKKARQFFADAVDRRLLAENPFRKIKPGSTSNPARMAYVPAAVVRQVIDSTADHEWKLVFALARFGGCRIPSEIRGLKWADINFDAGRMTVHSPKTEHHEGRRSRVVPISPELARMLTEALAAAEVGVVYVLPRLRHGTNLTTTAKKLIRRAAVAVWGKTFQNLRSSCETDWAMRFPIHVACAWAGNTQAVALRHYLQVTDEHFRAASGAAPRAPAGQTLYEQPNSNLSDLPGDLNTSMAPEGPELPAHILSRRGISKKALHRALQRLKVAAPYIYAGELEGLRRSFAHRAEVRR